VPASKSQIRKNSKKRRNQKERWFRASSKGEIEDLNGIQHHQASEGVADLTATQMLQKTLCELEWASFAS
jgi:hypothetical protein